MGWPLDFIIRTMQAVYLNPEPRLLRTFTHDPNRVMLRRTAAGTVQLEADSEGTLLNFSNRPSLASGYFRSGVDFFGC